MNSLVTIATYRRAETACFLKEKLQSLDIGSFFIYLGSIEDKTENIRVQVDAEDVEAAIREMMSIRDQYGMEIEEIDLPRSVRQIIVPTDFSKGSEDAVRYAVHLAAKLQAEIKLLHVFENPSKDVKMHSNETYGDYVQQVAEEKEQIAKADMTTFADKTKNYMTEQKIEGIIVHSAIAMGNIIRTIKSVCKTCLPDMIVLGTVGRREGTTSVFAGVAKELVTDLKIPLFAIPGPCPAEDFENMKILYTTDFNENDNNSLSQLVRITESFQKQITCIHIDTEKNPANETRMDELNDFLKKEYDSQDIQCRLIDYANVYQGIKDFADSEKMNLLSFTVQKRGIFELLFKPNLFRKILQEANLPILIFPS